MLCESIFEFYLLLINEDQKQPRARKLSDEDEDKMLSP